MAHFAKLDENNIVLEVHLVANDALDTNNEEQSGIEFLTNWSGGYTNWKQTSYNNNIRKQYAAPGFFYDSISDIFIAPQQYPSWSLNKDFDWQPPTPRPEGELWSWDEDSLSWIESTIL
jgi:hypothetical protein